MLQAEENATATADREVEAMIKDIAEEDQALEPMNHDNAESDMMRSSRSRPSQRTIGWMPGEGTFLKTLIKIGKFQAMP